MEAQPAVVSAIILAVLALVGTVWTAYTANKNARIARQPNEVEIRTADAAANDMILRLLAEARRIAEDTSARAAKADEQVVRLQREISSHAETSDNMREALAAAVADAKDAHAMVKRAKNRAARFEDAIRNLERRVLEVGHLSAGIAVVWAWNALDEAEPLIDLWDVPEHVQIKVDGVNSSLSKDQISEEEQS